MNDERARFQVQRHIDSHSAQWKYYQVISGSSTVGTITVGRGVKHTN